MNVEALSIVGLGKLGLPLAGVLADAGYQTLGVDLSESVVASINAGQAPFLEPGLGDLLARVGGQSLTATCDHRRAIVETDVTFILVATPSREDGSFSNEQVVAVLEALASELGTSDKPDHLFIISSTVVPGSTTGQFIPLIEKASGRKLNEGFHLAFDPDFVALGSVIRDFRNPDLVIIGESAPAAGDAVEQIHARICTNSPGIYRMSLINAEIAKVSLNVFVTLKVSFANTIANLCERIPGADCDAITQAIGADKRISPHYFSGGLAFGGTCFPRDTRAFKSISQGQDLAPMLVQAVEDVNRFQEEHLVAVVRDELQAMASPVVGILGLSFKSGTGVIVGSPAINLARKLLEYDVTVMGFDALASDPARAELGERFHVAPSIEDLLAHCGVCVVTYRCDAFRTALESYHPDRPFAVVDCWRQLSPDRMDPAIRWRPLGRHVEGA